jgi:hypothetical protein
MSNARRLFWGIAPEEVKPFWQSALVATGQNASTRARQLEFAEGASSLVLANAAPFGVAHGNIALSPSHFSV